MDYITPLHQFINYILSVKETLKLRDQKQVDHEELLRFLSESTSERDRTKSTGKSPGISGFIKDKIEEFKGVNPEGRRIELVGRLDGKVEEVSYRLNSGIIHTLTSSWKKQSRQVTKSANNSLPKSFPKSNSLTLSKYDLPNLDWRLQGII
jgi:hypothetical protein